MDIAMQQPENNVTGTGTDELRSSVRFPLSLSIHVITESNGKLVAQTQNISSGGVLFDVNETLCVGSRVEFQIDMPAGILGTPDDVAVQCIGRVVRCSGAREQKEVAAVIDDYCFERFSR